MKNLLLIPFIIVAVVSLVLGGCAEPTPAPAPPAPAPAPPTPAPAPVAPIKLLYAQTVTETSMNAPGRIAWGEELKKRSGGRVEVEHSWGGALGKRAEFLDLMRAGVCDIMPFSPMYAPGLVPMCEIISLPWLFQSGVPAVKTSVALYKAGYFEKETADLGAKLVCITCTGTAPILTTEKPINTLSDLKGLKMIAAAKVMQDLMVALGAVPTEVPFPEMYVSLQKGVVDGGMLPFAAMKMENMADVVDYAVEPTIAAGMQSGAVMNKDVFNNLPADVQAIIEDIMEEFGIAEAKVNDQNQQEGYDYFLETGGQITHWSEADLAEISKRSTGIWNGFITQWEAKGVPVKDAIDLAWHTLKAAGVDPPCVGYTPGD